MHDSGFLDGRLQFTDPEFYKIAADFIGESELKCGLDARMKNLCVLATLMGSQAADAFGLILPECLDEGVTPAEVKETAYQASAYLGFGRTYPFIKIINDVLASRGVKLPLESCATVTERTRLTAGEQAQVDIFGENMRGFASSGGEDRGVVNKWLSENCFGDYYTRGGLDLAEREAITFCLISAQGGCEPQLIAHAEGNFKVGNDKKYLISVILACLPYIGYPRSLNALNCVIKAAGNS